MTNNPELHPLLLELWTDLQNVRMLWQVAIVMESLFAAWLAGKLIQPRLVTPDGRRALGREASASMKHGHRSGKDALVEA